MTTYIDLASIGPTVEMATLRATLKGIVGLGIIYNTDRMAVLVDVATDGDTVVCGARALNFWRMLPDGVALVSIEQLGANDPLPLRFKDWLAWKLVQEGLTRTEAGSAIASPPKTEKHKWYEIYTKAQRYLPIVNMAEWGSPDLVPIGQTEAKVDDRDIPYEWMLVDSDEDIATFIDIIEAHDGSPIGIDVETQSAGDINDDANEKRDRLVGIGVAVGQRCFYGLYVNTGWIDVLNRYLPTMPWIGHGGKFDLAVLRAHKISVGPLVGDGLVVAYLLGLPIKGLKPLTLEYIGYRHITYEEVVGSGRNRRLMSDVDPKRQAIYCCGDAYFGVIIEQILKAKLPDRTREVYDNIDVPLIQLLVEMQEAGLFFDRGKATIALESVTEKQRSIESVVDFLARESGYARPDTISVCKTCRNGKKKREGCIECKGQGNFVNPTPLSLGSPTQLVDWLHNHSGYPVQRISRKTNAPSVDALALLRMQELNTAIPLILEWKRMEKYAQFLREWLNSSLKDHRIHTTITNTRVRSHRFSSEDPNLQQVRVPWRKFFLADKGHVLVAGDYAQIEVRIGTYVSQDPYLLSIVNADPNTPEGNIHVQNVQKIFNIPPEFKDENPEKYNAYKTRAKNYFFGAMYGSKGDEIHGVIEKQMLEDPSLAVLGIPTIGEIRKGVSEIHDICGRYFGEWVPYAVYMAKEQNNTAYTLYGRPRLIPNLTSRDKQEREAAERETISHIVQGTATADIMRLALMKVKDIVGGRILLSVHDEILCRVWEDKAMLYMSEMKDAMELGQPFDNVPLVVTMGQGKDWYETHG